jgi:hypothetical protein
MSVMPAHAGIQYSAALAFNMIDAEYWIIRFRG